MHVEADSEPFGPADVAAAIAEFVNAEADAVDLVLLGNDASDTGDFQVGIRLVLPLERPGRDRGLDPARRRATGRGPRRGPEGGEEVFELPAARGADRDGGRRRAALPVDPGRMKAKKVPIESPGRTNPARARARAAQAAAGRSPAR